MTETKLKKTSPAASRLYLYAGLGLIGAVVVPFVATGGSVMFTSPGARIHRSFIYDEPWMLDAMILAGYLGFAQVHFWAASRARRRALDGTNVGVPILAVVTLCLMTFTFAPTAFVVALLALALSTPNARSYARPVSPVALSAFYILLAAIHSFWDGFIVQMIKFAGRELRYAFGSSSVPILGLCGAFLFIFLFKFMPWHRRSGRFFWPSHLPRLKPRRKGMTLIELLIAIAILAIFAVAITQATMTTHRALQRQEEWRLAVDTADDQIALLRSRLELPALGAHPLDATLAERIAPLGRGEVHVGQGPGEGLRQVRITITIGGDANAREVKLEALLPARNPRSGGEP